MRSRLEQLTTMRTRPDKPAKNAVIRQHRPTLNLRLNIRRLIRRTLQLWRLRTNAQGFGWRFTRK